MGAHACARALAAVMGWCVRCSARLGMCMLAGARAGTHNTRTRASMPPQLPPSLCHPSPHVLHTCWHAVQAVPAPPLQPPPRPLHHHHRGPAQPQAQHRRRAGGAAPEGGAVRARCCWVGGRTVSVHVGPRPRTGLLAGGGGAAHVPGLAHTASLYQRVHRARPQAVEDNERLRAELAASKRLNERLRAY